MAAKRGTKVNRRAPSPVRIPAVEWHRLQADIRAIIAIFEDIGKADPLPGRRRAARLCAAFADVLTQDRAQPFWEPLLPFIGERGSGSNAFARAFTRQAKAFELPHGFALARALWGLAGGTGGAPLWIWAEPNLTPPRERQLSVWLPGDDDYLEALVNGRDYTLQLSLCGDQNGTDAVIETRAWVSSFRLPTAGSSVKELVLELGERLRPALDVAWAAARDTGRSLRCQVLFDPHDQRTSPDGPFLLVRPEWDKVRRGIPLDLWNPRPSAGVRERNRARDELAKVLFLAFAPSHFLAWPAGLGRRPVYERLAGRWAATNLEGKSAERVAIDEAQTGGATTGAAIRMQASRARRRGRRQPPA
jgi:hypothetical protein